MKSLVLDTNVAVAWYLPEDFSAAARRWQSRLLDNEVRLVEYEATAYDAVYIALAHSHRISLVTAERSTTPWVVKMGNQVETVTAP